MQPDSESVGAQCSDTEDDTHRLQPWTTEAYCKLY